MNSQETTKSFDAFDVCKSDTWFFYSLIYTDICFLANIYQDSTLRVANLLFDNKVDGRIHRPVFVNILRDRCNLDESKADQMYSQIDRRRSGVVQYEDLANFLQNNPTIRDQISDELNNLNDDSVK